MELFSKLISLALLAHVSLSVRVTLEGGSTGTFNKEVAVGESTVLGCSASPTEVSSSPSLEWLYAKTSTSTGTHLWHSAHPSDFQDETRKTIQDPYSLQINSLVSSDSGYYTCRVTMVKDTPSVGEGTYNLTVLVPPYSQISCGFPSDLKLTLGHKAQFQCREQVAQAVPSPTYTWYKNGILLPEKASDDPRFSNSSFSYSTATGIIMFPSVVAGDAGEYQCQAANKVGSERCTAAKITTEEQNIGLIVGIVFAVIFGILLIAVLIWWTWKRGYCDGLFDSKDHEDAPDDDGANDIMLDGAGPMVTKEPSEYSNGTSNKNSIRSTGTDRRMPEGAIRVMP